MTFRVGISSWSFPWAVGVPGYPRPAQPLTAPDLIRKTAAFGLDLIQIADNLPLHELSEGELVDLVALARRAGVEIEVGTKGVEPDRLGRYLEIARICGAKLVRTLTHSEVNRPDLGQVAAWVRQVLPAYEEAGVALALENYERHTAGEFAALVRQVGSLNFGICLDTVNNLGALETTAQVLDELAPYVLSLHVKDFEIRRIPCGMGFTVTGAPAGAGRLDTRGLLAEIRRHGRDPHLILEQWPPFLGGLKETIEQEAAWAAQGVRYLVSLAEQD